MEAKAHFADLERQGFTLCGLPAKTCTLADSATAYSASTGRLEVSLCDESGKAHGAVCRGCCDRWQTRQVRAIAALLTSEVFIVQQG